MKRLRPFLAISAALLGATAALAAATISTVAPADMSIGSSIDVKGTGFDGGVTAKPKPPLAWLTLVSDTSAKPKKIPLKVDKTTATDSEFHATLTNMPNGSNGAVTLHLLPRAKGATETTFTGAGVNALTIEKPTITTVAPGTGAKGALVTVTGTFFGTSKGRVLFGMASGKVKTWTDTSITVLVPPQKKSVVVGTKLDVTVHNKAGDAVKAASFTTQ